MKTKKIIPCLDINNGRVVKGVSFVDLKDAGDPVEIAQAYDKGGADEIVLLDITATTDGRDNQLKMVGEIAKKISIPFTVGGGIRTIDDFQRILAEGATKVGVNSAAIKDPSLISEASKKFGSERVVIAIDGKKRSDGSGWNVYSSGGHVDTGIDAAWWAKKVCELGAGAILLTSIDHDGSKSGYDIDMTRVVAESVSIPVIASGGAGSKEHIYEALTTGKASAALAASLFHYRELDIMDLKHYLEDNGIPVQWRT
ncbi:MAG TPA: imidazole glycerol phosphate synthase subunit HisF [Clostridiales bacterium]|nr:imidazole glycerol phosphate synthase subunit HisF [Clostridiales bacterium]